MLKHRPSQLDNDPSRTKWEDDNIWKSSSSTSDFYDEDQLPHIRRHYDNRYTHRRRHFVSSSESDTCVILFVSFLFFSFHIFYIIWQAPTDDLVGHNFINNWMWQLPITLPLDSGLLGIIRWEVVPQMPMGKISKLSSPSSSDKTLGSRFS